MVNGDVLQGIVDPNISTQVELDASPSHDEVRSGKGVSGPAGDEAAPVSKSSDCVGGGVAELLERPASGEKSAARASPGDDPELSALLHSDADMRLGLTIADSHDTTEKKENEGQETMLSPHTPFGQRLSAPPPSHQHVDAPALPAAKPKCPPEDEHSSLTPGEVVQTKKDEKLLEELTKAGQDKAKLEPDEFSKFESSCSTLRSSSPFSTTEAIREPDAETSPNSRPDSHLHGLHMCKDLDQVKLEPEEAVASTELASKTQFEGSVLRSSSPPPTTDAIHKSDILPPADHKESMDEPLHNALNPEVEEYLRRP